MSSISQSYAGLSQEISGLHSKIDQLSAKAAEAQQRSPNKIDQGVAKELKDFDREIHQIARKIKDINENATAKIASRGPLTEKDIKVVKDNNFLFTTALSKAIVFTTDVARKGIVSSDEATDLNDRLKTLKGQTDQKITTFTQKTLQKGEVIRPRSLSEETSSTSTLSAPKELTRSKSEKTLDLDNGTKSPRGEIKSTRRLSDVGTERSRSSSSSSSYSESVPSKKGGGLSFAGGLMDSPIPVGAARFSSGAAAFGSVPETDQAHKIDKAVKLLFGGGLLKTVGLFRVPAPKTEAIEVDANFLKGATTDNAHILGRIINQNLQQVFEKNQRFTKEVVRQFKTIDESPSATDEQKIEQKKKAILEILDNLNPDEKWYIGQALNLCFEILKPENEVNKMSIGALATCIGPNVFRVDAPAGATVMEQMEIGTLPSKIFNLLLTAYVDAREPGASTVRIAEEARDV